jgi:hypothetical protein
MAFKQARAAAPRTLDSVLTTLRLCEKAIERMAAPRRGRTWGRDSMMAEVKRLLAAGEMG